MAPIRIPNWGPHTGESQTCDLGSAQERLYDDRTVPGSNPAKDCP